MMMLKAARKKRPANSCAVHADVAQAHALAASRRDSPGKRRRRAGLRGAPLRAGSRRELLQRLVDLRPRSAPVTTIVVRRVRRRRQHEERAGSSTRPTVSRPSSCARARRRRADHEIDAIRPPGASGPTSTTGCSKRPMSEMSCTARIMRSIVAGVWRWPAARRGSAARPARPAAARRVGDVVDAGVAARRSAGRSASDRSASTIPSSPPASNRRGGAARR